MSDTSNVEPLDDENLSIASLIFYEPGFWEFPQRKFMSNHLHHVEGDLAGEDPYGFVLADSMAKMNGDESQLFVSYEEILPKPPPRAAKIHPEDYIKNLSVTKSSLQGDEKMLHQPRKTKFVEDHREENQRAVHSSSREVQTSHAAASFVTSADSSINEVEFDTEEKQDLESLSCGLNTISDKQEAKSMSSEYLRVKELLQQSVVNLERLKQLAWHGSPKMYRSIIWKMLLGYWPNVKSRRTEIVKRKREDYRTSLSRVFLQSHKSETEQERQIWRQITLDVPRICTEYNLFRIPAIQELLKRILYVWSVRHPACGYVQGMNDILMPLVYVLFSEAYQNIGNCTSPSFTTETESVASVSIRSVEMDRVLYMEDIGELRTQIDDIEADIYWCLNSVLESIQDFYTFAQPGIQRRIQSLERLVSRVCPNLYEHFKRQGVELVQFAFRWFNCLLIRELPFAVVVRLWDSVLCEEDGFGSFYVFICASLLHYFEKELIQMEFQELILFLQSIPNDIWTDSNVKMLLSQAYMWREMFAGSKNARPDRI